jgi:lipoprotein LprG
MRLTALAAAGLAGALALTSCSGDEDGGRDGGGDGSSAADVLERAKTDFDETSGLRIVLATDELPDGVTGIVSAEGVGTHAPAFDGAITVRLLGNSVEVPVVAVDDTVYAELPLTSGYQEVDPSEYGAPDPARLMSPDEGFSSLLTETTDLEDRGEERNPDDPGQVLRTIDGTVPGTAVENVIPSAEGDFEVSYGFEDGELRTVELTGAFYPDTEAMTYTLSFDDYGTEQDITAP